MYIPIPHSTAPSKNFTHREFAFTLANEAYLRYLSFATPEDLKKEVVRLNPARFEIGPVYTGRVSGGLEYEDVYHGTLTSTCARGDVGDLAEGQENIVESCFQTCFEGIHCRY